MRRLISEINLLTLAAAVLLLPLSCGDARTVSMQALADLQDGKHRQGTPRSGNFSCPSGR